MSTAKHARALIKPKPVVGAPLVEEGLQVIRVNRGFQIAFKPLVVGDESRHKVLEAPNSEKAHKTTSKQANDVVLTEFLLQQFGNTKLGTCFFQRDRFGECTNVKRISKDKRGSEVSVARVGSPIPNVCRGKEEGLIEKRRIRNARL